MPYNLIGHIINSIILMANVKPLFVSYCIALADVVAKLTVADLLAKACGRCYCHNSVVDVVTTCNIVL